jgi:hypothetical protein
MRAVCPHLPTQGGQRKEMKRLMLSSKISYRLSEEQRRRIEEEAEDAGMSANDWCRDAALEKLKNLHKAAEKSLPAETGNGMGRVAGELALLEEIARLGYRSSTVSGYNFPPTGQLMGSGFVASGNLRAPPPGWSK